MDKVIKDIALRRGRQAILEQRLVVSDLGVLKNGEPAFEIDTGRLKIGDGVSSYAELPYIGRDDRFVIQDPLTGQILLYDSELDKWVNKDLTDTQSIIYLAEHGLSIKGYSEAKQGEMPVKDTTDGIAWIKPVSAEQLDAIVVAATQAKNESERYATLSGNSAVQADRSAGIANRINQQTMDWVNNKFWWGSIEEYNALESINPGTYYFIGAEI